MKRSISILIISILFIAGCSSPAAKTVWLDQLDTSKMITSERPDRLIPDANTFTIAGRTFERGLRMRSDTVLAVTLDGNTEKFTASVGIDDLRIGRRRRRIPARGVEFKIYADKKLAWQSGVIEPNDVAKEVDLDIRGVKKLILQVADANKDVYSRGTRADWANAAFAVKGKDPVAVDVFNTKPYILTPKQSQKPQINGPTVFGAKPGSPFLYAVPAAGKRPIAFAAKGLPDGLYIDNATGQITGRAMQSGEYDVVLIAENPLGEAQRNFKIVIGDTIALTPPLGWNSWNCWGCAVDANHIKAAADAMAASGLVNHGWTYINIDDCWHGKRDPNTGVIGSNKKFGDMKALCDYVHSKGLKIGIYTDCGPATCQGYAGSEGHEMQDLLIYADWGFDYVKIDWCNCENKEPKSTYKIFGDALKQVPRDIVFSVCNWGNEDPWKWAAEIGGNCWRTTGDITDTWTSMARGFGQAGLSQYARPGHWNDPDMLVVGLVGWGPNLRQSRLTPDEQYTHISLWTLLASPLLLGCDLTKLDDFTLNLITNDEVLAVSQDPLGSQADRVVKEGDREVWARDLEDGSQAVGLFNLGLFEETISIDWESLGLDGPQGVRDLWRQKDLGVYNTEFKVTIPPHGVVLIKVSEE